jgi:hypothetical protein
MRTLNRPRSHITPTSHTSRRPARTDHTLARRPSAQRIADAVTASYIHDISQRHRPRRSRLAELATGSQ